MYEKDGGRRIQYPGTDRAEIDRKFPNLSDHLIVNQITFRNPEHEFLRFGVVHNLIGMVLALDMNIQGAFAFKQRMAKEKMQACEMWSLCEKERVKRNGLGGGNANRVRPFSDLQSMVSRNQRGAPILLPGKDEVQPKLEALQNVRDALNRLQNKRQHFHEYKATAAYKEYDKKRVRMQDLKQCQEDNDKDICKLEAGWGVERGAAGRGGDPPELDATLSLAQESELTHRHGALGGSLPPSLSLSLPPHPSLPFFLSCLRHLCYCGTTNDTGPACMGYM